MISFFNDPMVKFPKYPYLLPTVSVFEDSGYIFYGSVDGPFKLNGKKTREVVSKVMPLIRKKHTVFEILEKTSLSEDVVFKFLQILYTKSCLVDYVEYETLSSNDKNLLTSLSHHKNYRSLTDYKFSLKNRNVFISSHYQKLVDQLSVLLTEADFTVIDSENDIDNDTVILCINNTTIIEKYYKNNEVIYFGIQQDYLQVGPVFFDKAVKPSMYMPDIDNNSIINELNWCNQIASMTISFVMERSQTIPVDRFYVIDTNGELNSTTKVPYFKNSTGVSNIIAEYEDSCKFLATKYLNKNNHLVHYKDSNLKLTINNNTSSFWEKLPVEQKFKSSNIDNLIKSIIDFKENSNKKFSPTGGGLNSTLLYIINYDDEELYGKGIYSYSNIDKSYYRVNNIVDNLGMEEIVRHDSTQYKCLVIPVSDISVIASKYNDFAFKVANLNLGVTLSYILEKVRSCNISIDILFEFDEEQLLKCFSTTNNVESIGYAVGIKK